MVVRNLDYERFSDTILTRHLDIGSATTGPLLLDLGTGDGAYARWLARGNPAATVIAVDSCLDHLRGSAKRQPANLAFVLADARSLLFPREARFAAISINFPYASLLRATVHDAAFLARLAGLLAPGGRLAIRLNERAVSDADLEGAFVEFVRLSYVNFRQAATWRGVSSRSMNRDELRGFPSTWAKRIGWGRPSEAVEMVGISG